MSTLFTGSQQTIVAMLTSLALAFVFGSAPHTVAPDTLRPATEIRQVVLRHASDVRRCYEREGLRRNPELSGLIEIRITILPTGRVNDVALAASTVTGHGVDEVVRCIGSAARHWRFDRGAYPVETIVLPFRLAPIQAGNNSSRQWASQRITRCTAPVGAAPATWVQASPPGVAPAGERLAQA